MSTGQAGGRARRWPVNTNCIASLLMAKDAAAGMKYLSENHILHRDLAARNLLVKKEDTVKMLTRKIIKHFKFKCFFIIK